jgi:hypothetical protein
MSEIISKPEKEFRVGSVRAIVWANPRVSTDGRAFESRKVIIERIYKDHVEGFKSTESLDVNDIPKAILALKKAYEYILCSERQEKEAAPEPKPFQSASARIP